MVSMAVGTQHVDPMCGASVDRTEALRSGLRGSHGGTEYLFCGIACLVSFQEDPRRRLGLDVTRSIDPGPQGARGPLLAPVHE